MLGPFLTSLAIHGMGALYPAYATYKVVKRQIHERNIMNQQIEDDDGDDHATAMDGSKQPPSQGDLELWTFYWVLFGLFSAATAVGDVFLFWLPMYYEIKLLFIFFLVYPSTRSQTLIPLFNAVKGMLDEHEKHIDEHIVYANDTIRRKISNASNNAVRFASRHAESFAKMSVKALNKVQAATATPERSGKAIKIADDDEAASAEKAGGEKND